MIAVVAVAAALAMSSGADDTLVARTYLAGPTVARPATLRIDATHVVQHVAWRSWNGPAARGKGTLAVTRGGGAPRLQPAAIVLSGRRSCGAGSAYTRITVTPAVAGARPLHLSRFTLCDALTVGAPSTTSKFSKVPNCFDRPSACGYPDETTSGVVPGTLLTPVDDAPLPPGTSWDSDTRQLSIRTAGTVISGLDITGTVLIRAPRVTIANTRIVPPPSGFGIAIPNDSSADATRIVSVTIAGTPGDVAATAAISNRGFNDITIVSSVLRDCSQCFQTEAQSGGTTTIRDSYLRASDPQATCGGDCPHYQAIYASGNAGPMVLEHNTMLNPVDQTAVVFVNDGRQDNLTIADSLLAGGGYTVYGGGKSRRVSITGNRFSIAFRATGLDTFSGGPWPIPAVCPRARLAGCFGNLAQEPARGELEWSGNYWDDTLRPVRP